MKPARNTKPCDPAETAIGPIEMPNNPDRLKKDLAPFVAQGLFCQAVAWRSAVTGFVRSLVSRECQPDELSPDVVTGARMVVG